MNATSVQVLVRFLAQDAKVPLALAMGKVKELQQNELHDVAALAKTNLDILKTIFPDEKIAKQVFNAAKRVTKKRAAGEDAIPPAHKKQKETSIFSLPKEQSAEELEVSLTLPYSHATAEELMDVEVFSNRAPLVLALTVTLLKYTMPEQPLSSRLSLAQGYVGTTSRARAVSLGIEAGKSADEEGYGDGHPITSIMGKELRVLRRWNYTETTIQVGEKVKEEMSDVPGTTETNPALWALDLEASRKAAKGLGNQSAYTAGMPIYTPQSARAYLMKSFETPPVSGKTSTKPAAAQIAEKEKNLGQVLRAIDMLYESWLETITPDEVEKRVWGWYVKARPAVESGVAGWGGKNVWKLADILCSRRDKRQTLDSFFKKEPKDV